MHTAQPNAAHHALITDFGAVLARYQSMPAIERIAVMAQLIGQEIAECPRDFTTAEVLQAVALNIASGNQASGAALAIAASVGNGGGGHA